MSTYKQQDIENLLTHLREGVAPDSVLTLVDDVQIECDGAKEGESVWMHLVLPGARYGKDDRVTYDPYETYLERSLSCSGGLPMVEFYLLRGDDRPDATRNVKDLEPAPYLISRYYMKTLLGDHQGFGILLQDTPRLGLSADTVLDVQDALAETARACAAGCDFEIDAADADIARCIASGGYRGGAKVAAVYVPVGDLPRETTVFPDMDRALASIGLDRPETETLAEYDGVTVSLLRAAGGEDGGLKPNRALCRDGETEIIRGGLLVGPAGDFFPRRRDGPGRRARRPARVGDRERQGALRRPLVGPLPGNRRAREGGAPHPRRADRAGGADALRHRRAGVAACREAGRGRRAGREAHLKKIGPGATAMYRFGLARVSILQSGRSQLPNRHPNASPRPGARERAAAESGPQARVSTAPPPHPPERASDAGICWCG